MKMYQFIILCCLLLISFGCARNQPQRQPSYWDLPTTHMMPSTEQERQSECSRIRNRMAEVKTNFQAARIVFHNKMHILAAENSARKEYAALESRSATVGCTAAFSTTQSESKTNVSFDECFQNCKKYTSRTDGECFDSCKK